MGKRKLQDAKKEALDNVNKPTNNLYRADIHNIHTGQIDLMKYLKPRNEWQSLAYSPLRAVVSPPSEYCEKHLLTDHLSA